MKLIPIMITLDTMKEKVLSKIINLRITINSIVKI